MSDINTATDSSAEDAQAAETTETIGTAESAGNTDAVDAAAAPASRAGAAAATGSGTDAHTATSAQDPSAAQAHAASGTEILPLNDAEQTWVRDLLSYAKQLGIADSPQALEAFFEEQRTAWYAVGEAERADPNPLINLMGAVIGQTLVERCEMKWCVLIDEHGTSLAVASEVGSIAMFPMNAVAKRWTGQNMTTLTEFLQLAQAKVRRVREEQAGQ